MPAQPFQMSGQTIRKDKQNLVTWTIPYYIHSIADVFTVGSIPPHPGLVEEERESSDIEGAGMQVNVTYDGYVGEDPGEEEPEYEMDTSFKEESLLKNKNWQRIKDVYGGRVDGEDKQIIFPEKIQKSGRGLGGSTLTKDQQNPMYGSETYLTFGSVFRETFLSEKIPPDLLDYVGTIYNGALPKDYPTPRGRNWLRMPPKVSERGLIFQISRELLLSPAGGWVPEVHELIEF